MLSWFLSTSVLIAVVLLLRRLLRNRIDSRLTYALWLLVALRILIPVSLFSLPVSVATFTEQSGVSEAAEQVREVFSPKSVMTTSIPVDSDMTMEEVAESWNNSGLRVYDVRPYTEEELAEIRAENPNFYQNTDSRPLRMTVETLIGSRPFWNWVYLAGCFLTLIALSWSNRDFHRRIKKFRRPYEGELPVDCPIPVYVMPSLPSPCLYQMNRSAIYLNQAALESNHLDHILTHEIVHFRHKDQWWALVRILCLCVQWFNPLVWLAAYLSRQDCELACDASVIRILGEEQRLSYGKTLVDMIAAARFPGAFLQPATTMVSNKKGIAQRIQLIAKRPKMTAVTLAAVLLIAAVTAACTFGGAQDTEADTVLSQKWYSEYYTAEIVAAITDDTLFSDTNFHVSITSDYFAYEYSSGDSIHFNSLMSPKYAHTDMADTVYLVMDRFSPYADDFASVADTAKAYSVSETIQLLLLDDVLWVAFNIDTDRPVIHRLTTEAPAEEPNVTEPEFDSEAEAAIYHSLSQMIRGETSLTVSTLGHYLATDPHLEKQLPTHWLFNLSAAWESRFGSYTWTLCEGDPTVGATFRRMCMGRLCLSSDSISLGFGPDEYVSVTTDGETVWYQMGGSEYSFDASAQWLVSCVEQADNLTWDAAELTWDFPFPPGDVIDTAFPIDFSFDFDHYNAYIYGGAGYVHRNGYGYGGGANLQNEAGTLHWSPYFDQAVFFPETPLLTVTAFDKSDQPLVTATFTFHLVERREDGETYSAEVTLHGNTNYTCIKDPDTGGAMIVETALAPANIPPAELAQSVYAAIVGDYANRDFYMEVYDNRLGSGGTTTRIHITGENSWNLLNDVDDFEWAYAEPDECATPLALTLASPDGKTTLTCYDGCDAVNLSVNGEHYLLTAKVPEGRSSKSTLFNGLLRAADDALIFPISSTILIDGSVNDYGEVVKQFAEEYAATLNALPDWAPNKPEKTVYQSSSVSQAYWGEGTENFCGGFGLYFSPEMGNSAWQAGSGMDQETEGEYAGWWKWGIGADFVRNAEGDWVCTGTYTGGEFLDFPTPLEEATVEELVYYFYHTTGTAHSYLIPFHICQQPVSALEELNRLLEKSDDPAELCAALGAFLRDYGDYDDIQLTYEVLSQGLDDQFTAWVKESYISPSE